jgi:putative restriction endonuclease
MFRERVLAAYGRRCALSGLPEARLIDAAHIAPDSDERLGQPDVRNGICMSKIHHAAFDAGLIGIDPDLRIHISPQLLEMNDGPLLEQGLKALAGSRIRVPRDPLAVPDRERLANRFELFLASL